MNKRMKIIAGGTIVLALIACYVLVQAQQQKITLRYKLNVGDTWEYECITESEGEQDVPAPRGKSLRYIKKGFEYRVLKITPEGYFKVKLTTTPVESRGVNIDTLTGKKDEMHDFVAGHEFEETFINTKREVLTMTTSAKTAVFMDRNGGGITAPLSTPYVYMIEYLHPIMPDGEVGTNDTWNYPIVLIPEPMPAPVLKVWIDWYGQFPTLINYKIVSFEKKDEFDCVKIEYNYLYDEADKLSKIIAVADEETKGEILKDIEHRKEEIEIKGTGTLYFAYNEGFLVSRKENIIHTHTITELVNDKWVAQHKSIERIGFTMNYIKP